MDKKTRGKKFVMMVDRTDATRTVKELNATQKEFVYFWDDDSHNRGKGTSYLKVKIYKLPNEDYRKPVARSHIDE